MGEVIDIKTGLGIPTVVEVPEPEPVEELAPNCFACRNAMFGEGGTYCRLFQEDIWSEKLAAADCEGFERSDP